ncbi:hypothetical protein H0H81_004645, partial [Sphagnurus paluster]
MSILRDTHQALVDVFDLSGDLTVETICALHKTLMKTSRVLHTPGGDGNRFSHIHIGETRQAARINVTAQLAAGTRDVKIQFCPYDAVNEELNVFCERFN